jgi:hypothetical protein
MACEMAAWFALIEGRYNDVIDYAHAGQQLAGVSHAMVQLVLREARGRARLGQRREVRASLDRGTKLLEQLPQPEHPEHHFVFDHTKWIFYAATCYTWLGDDKAAEEHAHEIIAYHTNLDGSSNAPMRTANAHIDLGIVLARHGELDEAVDHGLFERKTEASLLSHTQPTSTTTWSSSTRANASPSPSAAVRRRPATLTKPASPKALSRPASPACS